MAIAQLPPSGLVDRHSERDALEQVVAGARAGQSRVLVLRGEAGVGKTALLEYLAEFADGCKIVRAAGVESEMELAFAGLHALCAPMLDRLDRLPEPQRDALSAAFGLTAGSAPDRFMVGLAVLTLLAETADGAPLICIVDDAQWLDRVSAQTLGFVARRVMAEGVGLVVAMRETGAEHPLGGAPELVVGALPADDARRLLETSVPRPLDDRLRAQILAEAAGNPLALLELPRGFAPAAVAGGFGRSEAARLTGRIEQGFVRQLERLPAEARRLLLLASAEPTGDVALLWRAADQLGIRPHAADAARAAGLFDVGAGVRFRHPLVRSAVYRTASIGDRRHVHGALAEVTDPQLDPDRRAWHRALAAEGPDEAVADELERSAGRAQARGGWAAAAAFLEQATTLTPDEERRARRAIAAATAMLQAGVFDSALALLATAAETRLDGLSRAQAELLRAQITLASRHSTEAVPLLLAAAHELEPLDDTLARETYLDAFSAARLSGRAAGSLGLDVARAARRLPPPADGPRVLDLLLESLIARFSEPAAAGTPIRRHAVRELHEDALSPEQGLRWLWLASSEAAEVWDDERWIALSARHVDLARAAGALSVLAPTLHSRAMAHVLAGELDAAAALAVEIDSVQEATGMQLAPYAQLGLAAWRGRERELDALAAATLSDVAARGEGAAARIVDWARAVLANGLGRHDAAVRAALRAADEPEGSGPAHWALSELVEAAARTAQPELAAEALARLGPTTRAGGTDWALGIRARAQAQLDGSDSAESLYREAIERLARTRLRSELARSHLLFGEWLRRRGERVQARAQLRTAFDQLADMGADAFAERARRELAATGESIRRRTDDTRDELTPQEAQIARLAADGHTNPEIGTRLFLSPRTVEYHLRKVFTKLGIQSRRELAAALAGERGRA